MKRVLFYSEGWGLGGIETFIMNTIRELPRDQFQCDVVCTHDWSNAHDEELTSLGAHRYCVFHGFKPNQLRRLTTSTREFRKLLRKNAYDVVHICTMNGMGFLYSNIARQENVPVRIVHSHNSTFGQGHQLVKKLMHNVGKKLWKKTATQLIACSDEAGHYLFDDSPYFLLPNGIDTSQFQFSEKRRAAIRNKLHLPQEAFVFGSIGRIADVKQPLFQVDILCKLREEGVAAYLLLVGDGPLSSTVEDYAQEAGVSDFLRLPGATNNPANYYSALDVFTMPSLFEGMPMVLIEAAASGVPCYTSSHIPQLPYPLKRVKSVSGDNVENWVSAVLSSSQMRENSARSAAAKEVSDAGYAVKTMVEKLMTLYE